MVDKVFQPDKDELILKLLEIGCCQLCSLRLSGETNATEFQKPSESAKGLKGTENKDESERVAKQTKTNPCIACLGLLQKSSFDVILDKVCAEIELGGYDSEDFSVALNIPVAFQVRAHCLWVYLQEEAGGDYIQEAFPLGCVTVSVKDAWKMVAPQLIEARVSKKYRPDSEFQVQITLDYPDNDADCLCLFSMVPEVFGKKRGRRCKGMETYSRKGIEQAFKSIEMDKFREHCPPPPSVPSTYVTCSRVALQHYSIYMVGRYNKWCRVLPQTPWIIGGERKMDTSVQELICGHLQEETQAQGVKFGASGREDVDVRTLGRGRPFSVELLNPRKVRLTRKDLQSLEERINSNASHRIAVRHLQLAPKDSLSELKLGEETKTKEYKALCVVEGSLPPGLDSLSSKAPITLAQRTPIRVLHRRPVAERQRTVHWVNATPLPHVCLEPGKSYFSLEMETQAGTYIKEFVHGDFGRTRPCLGDLLGGVEVDILALDVTEISLDWPPPIDYTAE